LGRLTRHFLLQLLLEGFEIEARALLHGQEIKECLRELCDLILDEGEAPEFVGEPIIERQGSA
jgi:hypothetical protein